MMTDKRLPLACLLAAGAVLAAARLSAGDPPANLVPFPEDAQQPRPAAAARPARPLPPKSDFKPHFRTPDVQQPDVQRVEHLEPAADDSKPQASDDGPQLMSAAAEANAAVNLGDVHGREALNLAYTKSKTAATADEYYEVVELCRQSKRDGVGEKFDAYADQLIGWALNRRGEAYAKEGRELDALADFEAAVATGGAWRAVHNRGVAFASAGRLEEARADFDRVISVNPRYAPAYLNRGELRYQQEDYPGAIDDYTASLKLGPPEAAAYMGRGHAFYRMQRFGDALRDYGEAIHLDPENPDAHINRGDTYCDVGKYGEAAKDYREAVRIAPESGRAYQAVAWLMATCPDTHYREAKLAVDAAKRAVELDGATYRNLSTLAAAQANAELFDAAQKTQEEAIAAADKSEVVAAEKMMSLYQRQIAFRDRPFTAFKTPEEMNDKEVRQASAEQPREPQSRRAWFQQPDQPQPPARTQQGMQAPPRQLPEASQFPGMFREQQMPQRQQPQRPPKARLFAPRGKI